MAAYQAYSFTGPYLCGLAWRAGSAICCVWLLGETVVSFDSSVTGIFIAAAYLGDSIWYIVSETRCYLGKLIGNSLVACRHRMRLFRTYWFWVNDMTVLVDGGAELELFATRKNTKVSRRSTI